MKGAFCLKNKISRGQLDNILREPDKRTLPPYYIACLCRDYGQSAEWILLGEEKAVSPDKAFPQPKTTNHQL